MKTNTHFSGTIDIKVVFQKTKILYFDPDGNEITWTYYYATDFENIIFEELKVLVPGEFDSVAQKFAQLLGIDKIIELYKNRCIHLYIQISRETSRYPWNLLRFLHKNILVFPVLDVETSQLRELALKKINFLIIANMNYFATNENLLLFEEELQSIRNRLEPLGNSIALKILYTPDLEKLKRTLAAEQFHIVHHIGHSEYVPKYDQIFFQFLENASNKIHRLDIGTFGKLLENQKELHLVFINSCKSGYPTADFSHSAASFQILHTGTCALAMRYAVNDLIGKYIGDFYINYFQGELKEAFKKLIDNLENKIKFYFSPVLYLPHKGRFVLRLPGAGKSASPSPYPRAPRMVGREGELNRLARLLEANTTINIHGPAKIGKTMLIQSFLDRNQFQFSKETVIHQKETSTIYSFFDRDVKKNIIESKHKIEHLMEWEPIIGLGEIEYLHLGDLSEAEAAFLFYVTKGRIVKNEPDLNRLSRTSRFTLLRNPYLIVNQSDFDNSLELIDREYGSEIGRNFSEEELSMILLLVLAPFPLSLADFDILSRVMLFPHGKNYRAILQQYIEQNWIALVDNRIRIYSHAFLKLNANDFNGLDKKILERNARASMQFINYYKKEYRNTENEALTVFLAKKEYFLGWLVGDAERISELSIWNALNEVETCRSKEIAKSKVKKALQHHAILNPGSEKNLFLHSSVMAQLYRKWNDKPNAIIHYKEAIKEFERLNLIENNDGFLRYANLLFELGNLQNTSKLQLNYFEEALKYYKKSGDRQEIEYMERMVNHLKRIGGV